MAVKKPVKETTLAVGEEDAARKRGTMTTTAVGEETTGGTTKDPTPYVKDGEDERSGRSAAGTVPGDNPLGAF